ncbi:hypothetical protein E2C01_075147 [Portunus trituberculatus]|uniref:Uncharacterized protein n=1 Tax=Portunus trituberculatus TaxID=210409 RepID=A0A5B7IEB4_PORTR|nr:hypothetical protein [Portunus trituberculatus]
MPGWGPGWARWPAWDREAPGHGPLGQGPPGWWLTAVFGRPKVAWSQVIKQKNIVHNFVSNKEEKIDSEKKAVRRESLPVQGGNTGRVVLGGARRVCTPRPSAVSGARLRLGGTGRRGHLLLTGWITDCS